MITTQPARPTTRRVRIRGNRVAALVIVAAAIAAALGYHSPRFSSPSAPLSLTAPSPSTAAPFIGAVRSDHGGALGEAGGAVPDGATVFDGEAPAVARLNPALLRALRRTATDAAADGVELVVNGGWRSPAYEDQLRREAISKYGSEAQAARWVATGTTSAHVSGNAVDIGPASATPWLSAHGAAYGLCQIYGNEPWHYELRPQAASRGCPPMYADPTHDPRMQR